MKKELRRALETAVAERLPEVLGEGYKRLKPLPKGEEYFVVPGEFVYADTSNPALARFISFIPQKGEDFIVELGWSRDGDFPRTTARPSARAEDVLPAPPSQGFVRVTQFYSRLGESWDAFPCELNDPNWIMRAVEFAMHKHEPGEAMALIKPIVEDALVKVQEHAPAFFDALEAKFGAAR